MRLQSHHTFYSAPLLLLLSSTLAQEDSSDNNELIGCVDLECPTADNATSNNCTVGDTEFQAIGVAPDAFSVPLSGKDNSSSFSWTVGAANLGSFTPNPTNDSERIIEQHFFVGSPSGVDLSQNASDLGAEICAFFFSQSDNNTLGWKDEWEDATDGSSECGSYIGDDCTQDLISTALKQAKKSGGTTDCASIGEEIQSSLSDICPDLGVEDVEDIKVSAVALTGGNSELDSLTGPANSSSNCHPTMPQSNVLTPVRDVTIGMRMGRVPTNVLVRAGGGFTPILTLAVPESDDSEESESSASMTCVHPLGVSQEALDNRVAEDDGEDAGMSLTPHWGTLSALLAVAGAVALQL